MWHRFHEEHQWTAYQEALKEYIAMLKSARKTKMSETILECGTNTKCLYSLVNSIIGKLEKSPFPDDLSDNDLAEEFEDFFLNKITKIRDDLEQRNSTLIMSRVFTGEHLKNFHPMTEEEVPKIMNSVPTKSCELNSLPVKLLRKLHLKLYSTLQDSPTFP